VPVNDIVIGNRLAQARRKARLSQAEVARRMGTSQPAISRAESGRCTATLSFLERFAAATSSDVRRLVRPSAPLSDRQRRDRVRRALEGRVFDPWDREPTLAEARSLEADGLTRERFESEEASGARRGGA
jgi:transcriptional regulator with XRE-family HTH domain